MPNQNKPTQDLRIDSKLQKKLSGALDILEISAAPIIENYNSTPEKVRPQVLEHSPILNRLVKLLELIK